MIQSLARAAYSGKQTLLLDDCLSGLDNETAKKCFNALFSDQGYFRRSGVAVVMASHSGMRVQSPCNEHF